MKTYLNNFFKDYKSDFLQTISLSTPIIIGQLGVVLMGVADILMLGWLPADRSPAQMAAAGAANDVYFAIVVIGIGALSMLSPAIAKANEEKDFGKCNLWLRSGIIFSFIMTAILAVLLIFATENFEFFRQQPDVTPLAKDYLWIVLFALPPLMLFVGLRQFTDGLEFTKIAMQATVFALFLNVFLNYLLIFGNWGFPVLEIKGAAIATVISRYFMVAVMLIYIFKTSLFKEYIKAKFDISLYKETLTNISKSGFPVGLAFFFEIAAFAAASILIGQISTNQQAAHQVAIKLASTTYMFVSGISIACAIRVGQSMGQRNREGVFKAGLSALLLSGGTMLVFCMIFLVFPAPLVKMSTENVEVMKYAMIMLMIAGFFQLFDGIQVTALGALRGMADTFVPTTITMIAYWVIAIPLGYFLAFELKMEGTGIWIGLLVGLAVSAILLTIRFFRLVKKDKKSFGVLS